MARAAAAQTTINLNLNDLDQEDLLTYVANAYGPSDVFPENELREWATENGYIVNPD